MPSSSRNGPSKPTSRWARRAEAGRPLQRGPGELRRAGWRAGDVRRAAQRRLPGRDFPGEASRQDRLSRSDPAATVARGSAGARRFAARQVRHRRTEDLGLTWVAAAFGIAGGLALAVSLARVLFGQRLFTRAVAG